MQLPEIREKLSDRNLAEVGRRIGVTRVWLNAIRRGVVTELSEDMHKKLTDYLKAN